MKTSYTLWIGALTIGIFIFTSMVSFYSDELEIISGIIGIQWKRFRTPILPTQKVDWLSDYTELTSSHSSGKPNILMILVDDLGYNDLSDYSIDPDFFEKRYGANTPNINSIRNNGVNFAQSYSGHSTCTPSRTALFTGQFPTRTGVEFTAVPRFISKFAMRKRPVNSPQAVYNRHLEPEVPLLVNNDIISKETPMLSTMLRSQGYKNYFIGKWDHGHGQQRSPQTRDFDESLVFQVGASQYLPPGDSRLVSPSGLIFDRILTSALSFHVQHNGGPRFAPGEYMTDYLAHETASLIHALDKRKPHVKRNNQTNDPSMPWYIQLSFNAPHNPFQALRTDYDAPELAHIPEGMPRTYAAMIHALDRGVGVVLKALKESNQNDNTIVVFTSDNGGADYTSLPYVNSPMRGWKLSLFEGGIRVPMFMQWPGKIRPGQVVNDRAVSHVDVVPTLMDAATEHTKRLDETFELPRFDGQSLLPLVQDTATSVQFPITRPLYWRSGHYKAIRFGNMKLQIADRPNKVWFFDIANDYREEINLSKVFLNISTVEELQSHCRSTELKENGGSFANIASNDATNVGAQICLVYQQLMEVDAVQSTPRWPALAEIPLCIDKVATQTCLLTDEYIVVPN